MMRERLDVAALLEDLRATAAARDLDRTIPADEVRALKAAGIGALRVPANRGGAGVTLTELFEFVGALAHADPNVAHALRNHFSFVERVVSAAPSAERDRWIGVVLAGDLIGDASGELTASRAGAIEFTTTLRTVDGRYRLDGRKFYSTGNIYADQLVVSAVDEHGRAVTVAVPADREGVDLTDDWDGIGQRLTGSGSTTFRAVDVEASEIMSIGGLGAPARAYVATFTQLYLTTVVAGIVRAMLSDAVRIAQERTRNYYHGHAEHPRHEEPVQMTIGQLSATAYAAEAVVVQAVRALEDAWALTGEAAQEADLAAALAAARAKVVIDDLAGRAGWLLFDVGGATAVREGENLDRHWRNARTLASHNPSSYKLRSLGDYELNATPPPQGSFF